MNIDTRERRLTIHQLKRVPAPSPESARKLEEEFSNYGDVHEVALAVLSRSQAARRECNRSWQAAAVAGLGAVGLAAALPPAAGLALAGAAGVMAMACAFQSLVITHEMKADQNFFSDLGKWDQAAQEQLHQPGSEPGTTVNHEFFEAGIFASLSDVRRGNQVLARDAELSTGVRLHEDVAAHSLSVGNKIFANASLQLPVHPEDPLRITVWEADKQNVQTLFWSGGSYLHQGRMSVKVHSDPVFVEDAPMGLILPDGTQRMNISNAQKPRPDVLLVRPPVSALDLDPQAPTYQASTFADLGAIYRTLPPGGAPDACFTRVDQASLLVGAQLPVGDGSLVANEDLATHSVSLLRQGQVVETRPGHLDLQGRRLQQNQNGLLVEQGLRDYPEVRVKADSLQLFIDRHDNVSAVKDGVSVPAHLDGRTVTAGGLHFELPLPRPSSSSRPPRIQSWSLART